MKTLAQAVKKISIDQSISPDKVLYSKHPDGAYTLLDTVNRESYRLENGFISKSEFDPDSFNETVEQGVFGNISKLIEELYSGRFGNLLDIGKNINDEMDQERFLKEFQNFMIQRNPGLEFEIADFISKNARELYRKFKLKFVVNKQKLEKDLGKGTSGNSSKDSKGVFINMPSRP